EGEPGAGRVLVEDDRHAAGPLQRAALRRLPFQLGRQGEHLGLLLGCQVVVAQEMPRHDAAFAAVSRTAGSAARNASTCSSVMTSGGASRTTSGAAALTRNPAARAAASTGLAAGEVSTTPHSRPRPRTWSTSECLRSSIPEA